MALNNQPKRCNLPFASIPHPSSTIRSRFVRRRKKISNEGWVDDLDPEERQMMEFVGGEYLEDAALFFLLWQGRCEWLCGGVGVGT